MGGAFSRNKGQRAEREVVKLLQPVVTKLCREAGWSEESIPVLERNLMQSNRGGFDIAGLEWMALEVKHQEILKLADWWEQSNSQSKAGQTPILFFKQNRSKWKVRMWGYVEVGVRRVKCPVEVTLDSFMVYFEERVRVEIGRRED